MKNGDTVNFRFTPYRVSLSDPQPAQRSGRGVLLGESYQCWPPGYSVRVTESPDYAPGEVIAVGDIDVVKS